MLVQACVNGARRPGAHPALPVTAHALAAAVADVVAAGARSVHLHVKDAAGRDTLAADPLAQVLHAVRAAAPGPEVGVTTGAWAASDVTARVAAVRSWSSLPDLASVNWHEDGADDMAATLRSRGVGIEAGLWHEDGVRAWARSPHRDACARVLLEIPPDVDAADAADVADALLRDVRAVTPDVPVLLHGEDANAWPVLHHALRLGLDSRIGLEDVLVLPDGTPAPDNAALVRAAVALVG